jgi:hypothetical protein
VPAFAGLEGFQGTWGHTGRWPQHGLERTGQRVGVMGPGASAVQLLPDLATDVAQLPVFQRTAPSCVPLRQRAIDPAWQRQLQARAPAIFQPCHATPCGLLHAFAPRSALAVAPDERQAPDERLGAEPGYKPGRAHFYAIRPPGEAHADYVEFVRQKSRERVQELWWRTSSCPRPIPAAPSACRVSAAMRKCATRIMWSWWLCARPQASAAPPRASKPGRPSPHGTSSSLPRARTP